MMGLVLKQKWIFGQMKTIKIATDMLSWILIPDLIGTGNMNCLLNPVIFCDIK